MLVFDDFDDPIGVGMPFLGVEGHDAGVPVGRVGQAVGRDLRDCGAGRVGNRLLRPDITPMPADLHDHAHHADGGEQDASAYCTDGYRGDRNNQRQYAQPRHQRDDKRHVPFAVEVVGQHAQQHGQQDDGGDQPEHRGQKVCCCGTAGHAMLRAVEGAAGACFVELRAQILDFAFACAFAFGIVIAAVLTLAFAGLPHGCLSLRSRSPYATRHRCATSFPRGSQCFYVHPYRMPLCGHFSLISYCGEWRHLSKPRS